MVQSTSGRRMMRNTIVVLILFVAVFAFGSGVYACFTLRSPMGLEQVVEVVPGDTLRGVFGRLGEGEHSGSARWRQGCVIVYARLLGQTSIRSGSYKVAPSTTPLQMLRALNQGRVQLERVTVAEGLNRWQVRDLLVRQGWLTAKAFDALCDDASFLRAAHVPGPTCEGYLFPETYTLARGISARYLLGAMMASYRIQIERVLARAERTLELSEGELVTLASIVEKETGAAEERPRIACVFYNRLHASPPWRLETDPTVIYAATLVDPTFDGNLTRLHLRDLDNPYNTYRVHGLPPGPIANPGRAALDAVVDPATCGDYFFVSQNNGRHVFCETLTCHRQAVKKWQVDYFRGVASSRGGALR